MNPEINNSNIPKEQICPSVYTGVNSLDTIIRGYTSLGWVVQQIIPYKTNYYYILLNKY